MPWKSVHRCQSSKVSSRRLPGAASDLVRRITNMSKAFILAVLGTLGFVVQVGIAQVPPSLPTLVQGLQQRLTETEQRLDSLRSRARARQSVLVLNEFDLRALMQLSTSVNDRLREETAGMTPEQIEARQAEIDRLTRRLAFERGEMYRLEAGELRLQVQDLQRQVAGLQLQLNNR